MSGANEYLGELWASRGYLFSNIPVLLLGGLLYILPVALALVIIAWTQNSSHIANPPQIFATIGILCMVFIVYVVVSCVFDGYFVRLTRSIYRRETTMPALFHDLNGLVRDIVAYLSIAVIYVILGCFIIFPILILVILLSGVFHGISGISHMGLTFEILSRLGYIAITTVAVVILITAVSLYVARGKILVAAHPLNVIGILSADWGASSVVVVVTVLITVIGQVINYVLSYSITHFTGLYGNVVVILISLLISCVSFITLLLNAYLIGKLILHVEALTGTLVPATEKGAVDT